MPAVQVEVVSTIVGPAPAGPQLPSVRLSLASERIRVRELVRRVVTEQLRDLQERRPSSACAPADALARHYLTQDEIDAAAREGRVRLQSKLETDADLDLEDEISRALRGFARGAFRVVVGGEMHMDPDEELTLTPDAKVTFLRLLPLAGG